MPFPVLLYFFAPYYSQQLTNPLVCVPNAPAFTGNAYKSFTIIIFFNALIHWGVAKR